MSEPVSRRLTGISAKAYQHPADAAATAALQSIPGLDAVVRKLIEFRYERAFRQALLASSVRIGPDQLPDVWDSYKRALDTLDMPGLYDPYLTQAPEANARTLMVLAGGVGSKRLSIDAFLRQGQDFHGWSSAWDRLSRLMSQLDLTHSYPVRRVAELMEWVRVGDYDRIIGGDYMRRDAKPDPREHACKAYDHYRERFRRTFEDAGESADRAIERMAEWLQGRR
jgi:hypothetical protein